MGLTGEQVGIVNIAVELALHVEILATAAPGRLSFGFYGNALFPDEFEPFFYGAVHFPVYRTLGPGVGEEGQNAGKVACLGLGELLFTTQKTLLTVKQDVVARRKVVVGAGQPGEIGRASCRERV